MNGQLSEHPLAELIREATTAKLSGALRLRRGRVRAVVYVRHGEVVYARSNLRAHHLVACAQRSGLFSAERLSASVTELMDDAEAAAALVASGATRDEMARLRASQSSDVMRPFLVWTDGEWGFVPRAQPDEEVRTVVAHGELLLEAARRLPPEFAAARLSDDGETLSPASPLPAADLRLLPVEGFVLSRVDAPTSVGELVAVSGLPEEQTRQAAYALALAGLLARERWPAALTGEGAEASAHLFSDFEEEREQARAESASAKAPDARAERGEKEREPEPEPRELMRELIGRVYEANYFQILGVGRAATPAEIKRAYYGLARRFHPDRFRQEVGDSERAEIETAFALVTKAYETLHDPSERATYESRLPVESARAAPSPVSRPQPRVAPQGAAKGAAKDAAKKNADPTAAPQYRAEENFQQGLAALDRNDADGARLFFGEAVRLAPQQARYHAFYGRALMNESATRRQAESELQAAARLDPGNASYRVALAELYNSLRLPRRAEGELARALSIDPDNAAALQMLGQIKKE